MLIGLAKPPEQRVGPLIGHDVTRLGQPIGVTLVVLGPDGPITDPSALAKLQVGVSVSGDGLSGSIPVSVSQGPATDVGEYEGRFTAPQRAGTLTFTGIVAGYGLHVTEVAAPVQVGSGVSAFSGTVQIPATSAVQQGESLNGDVVFANKTDAARTVRLSLSVSHAYATITSPAGTIRVPAGDSVTTPFTITFAKDSPLGNAWLEVQVVDAGKPGTVYGVGTSVVAVTNLPGFDPRHRTRLPRRHHQPQPGRFRLDPAWRRHSHR